MTKKLNKKKLIGVLILIITIIVLIFLVGRTFSRYESVATVQKDLDVAFWVVDDTFKTETVILEDIYPSDDEYAYEFSVLNNDGTKVAETAMKYEVQLIATTNMPLEYRIEKNGQPATATETLYTDENGTYFKKLVLDSATNSLTFNATRTEGFTKKVEDEFTIYVKFPKKYKSEVLFADLIECINLQVTASQVISGE